MILQNYIDACMLIIKEFCARIDISWRRSAHSKKRGKGFVLWSSRLILAACMKQSVEQREKGKEVIR